MGEFPVGLSGVAAAVVLALAGVMLVRKLVKLAIVLLVLAGAGILLYARYAA